MEKDLSSQRKACKHPNICEAAQVDGIICPVDCCDYENGTRKRPHMMVTGYHDGQFVREPVQLNEIHETLRKILRHCEHNSNPLPFELIEEIKKYV